MILIVFKVLNPIEKISRQLSFFLQKNIRTDVFNNYAQRINLFKSGDYKVLLPQYCGNKTL